MVVNLAQFVAWTLDVVKSPVHWRQSPNSKDTAGKRRAVNEEDDVAGCEAQGQLLLPQWNALLP